MILQDNTTKDTKGVLPGGAVIGGAKKYGLSLEGGTHRKDAKRAKGDMPLVLRLTRLEKDSVMAWKAGGFGKLTSRSLLRPLGHGKSPARSRGSRCRVTEWATPSRPSRLCGEKPFPTATALPARRDATAPRPVPLRGLRVLRGFEPGTKELPHAEDQ